MSVRVVDLVPVDAHLWLPAALNVYVTAMNYPPGTAEQRSPLWREHLHRPGWRAVAALAPAAPGARPIELIRRSDNPAGPNPETLVGIAYGYPGAPNQWWNQQLRQGLSRVGYQQSHIDDIAGDYFELTELHVHPDTQGRGIGQWLLTRLLAGRTESKVLLSTPEVAEEDNRAWQLYRRMGFVDVLRQFTFSGDPRRFAVLGRTLPL